MEGDFVTGYSQQSVDPRKDARPLALRVFNTDFVNPPKDKVDAIKPLAVYASVVEDAWKATDWGHLKYVGATGSHVVCAEKSAFVACLVYLGTNRLRYVDPTFVCRNYSTLFSSIVNAELHVNSGIVTDWTGEHMYNAVPVWSGDRAEPTVEWVICEPQLDKVVLHTDPARHYTGKEGFVFVV